jgi:hypothetical protein
VSGWPAAAWSAVAGVDSMVALSGATGKEQNKQQTTTDNNNNKQPLSKSCLSSSSVVQGLLRHSFKYRGLQSVAILWHQLTCYLQIR